MNTEFTNQIDQLELFPGLVDSFQRSTPKRSAAAEDDKHAFMLRLFRILQIENISAITWALLTAIDRANGQRPYTDLQSDTGLSYHAIRNQVLRSHYFEPCRIASVVHAKLTTDGAEKITRIRRRLTTR